MVFTGLLTMLHQPRHPDAKQLGKAEKINCAALAARNSTTAFQKPQSCLLSCQNPARAEAVLGLIPGVLATQVCVPAPPRDLVRVVYDNAVTKPEIIAKQSGLTLEDATGTAKHRVAPAPLQKAALQQVPLGTRWLKAAEEDQSQPHSYLSPRVPDHPATFAMRLNSYCSGYGTEEEVQADAVYLPEEDCKLLLQLWAQKRQTATTP